MRVFGTFHVKGHPRGALISTSLIKGLDIVPRCGTLQGKGGGQRQSPQRAGAERARTASRGTTGRTERSGRRRGSVADHEAQGREPCPLTWVDRQPSPAPPGEQLSRPLVSPRGPRTFLCHRVPRSPSLVGSQLCCPLGEEMMGRASSGCCLSSPPPCTVLVGLVFQEDRPLQVDFACPYLPIGLPSLVTFSPALVCRSARG